MIQVAMGPTELTLATLILYGAAEGLSIAHLRSDKPAQGHAATALLGCGFLLHFLALHVGARATHSVPYRDLADSLSFFSWLVTGAYGFLFLRHREGAAGPFLIPLSILFLALSLFAHPHEPVTADPARKGILFAYHVTISFLGYAALTLSFVLAQLYLIQDRQIRRHRLGLLFSRLPALDVLARLHRTAVATGVGALGLGMLLGLVWARQHWKTFLDPKLLITAGVLALYGSTLLARRLGWGGRRVAHISIAGFLTVLFSYSVVNLFLSQGHAFK